MIERPTVSNPEPERRIELLTYSLRVIWHSTQCNQPKHAGHKHAGHDAVQPNELLSLQQLSRRTGAAFWARIGKTSPRTVSSGDVTSSLVTDIP